MVSEKVTKRLNKIRCSFLIGGILIALIAVLAQELGFEVEAEWGEWIVSLGLGMWFLGMFLLPGGSSGGDGGDGGE